MAIKFIGVRRNLRKGRLTRRKKYFGQKGWNWQEPILSNTFTNIDNIPSNGLQLIAGSDFNTPTTTSAVGGGSNNTVVVRAIHMQAQVSVVLPELGLYPYVAYDVGLVKFEAGTADLTNLTTDLQGIQLSSSNRVFFHRRVWAAAQPAFVDDTENGIPYSADPASSFLDVSIRRLNMPLSETEQLGIVLSQCDSELYTDGTEALLTGYVKSYVQIK